MSKCEWHPDFDEDDCEPCLQIEAAWAEHLADSRKEERNART